MSGPKTERLEGKVGNRERLGRKGFSYIGETSGPPGKASRKQDGTCLDYSGRREKYINVGIKRAFK